MKTRYPLFVVQWDDTNLDTRRIMHIIRFAKECKGGVYRQLVSYEAFRKRNRCNETKDNIKFHGEDTIALHVSAKLLNKKPSELMDFVKHDSVWDFYEYIGWDYKNKEFVI